MCFVWIWEQTAIISLHNISWLVFTTETVRVYSAVRTEYFNIEVPSSVWKCELFLISVTKKIIFSFPQWLTGYGAYPASKPMCAEDGWGV